MDENQTILYERYNYDDVFNRSVIVGLLNLMNETMKYEQIWENNVVEEVAVPVMYDFGSSEERFCQNNYAFFGNSCFGGHMITGKFDMFPRGAIRYTGSQIEASSITNRFIQVQYMKNLNGKLESYTTFLYSMPISFNFDCEFWCDNLISAFKIEQAIRDTFYKNKTYNVLYRGIKIGCRVGFPEAATIEKTTEYSFDPDRTIKIKFNLAVESYQPVFDKTVEIPSEHYIKNVAYDIKLGGQDINRPRSLTFTDRSLEGTTHPAGSELKLRWKKESLISDMVTLTLSWIDEDGISHDIDNGVIYNHEEYTWKVPDDFTGFIQPSISYISNENITMIQAPEVRIVPEANGMISEESFIILNGGQFYSKGQANKIQAIIDYIDTDGNIRISDKYAFNIIGGEANSVAFIGEQV